MLKFHFQKTIKIITIAAIVCMDMAYANPLYADAPPMMKIQSSKASKSDDLQAAPSDVLPMVHNNNYDMLMPDYYDHHPAASMQYQNFESFYDPQMIDENEFKMVESQFILSNPVRAPQPLTAEERAIREHVDEVDSKHEKKILHKFKKGSTKPRPDSEQWDRFDYDDYSTHPDKKHYKKPIHG